MTLYYRADPANARTLGLRGEAGMPANCFSLGPDRTLSEGIRLSLNHPTLSGKAALFVDDYYVLVNFARPCNFDATGLVRRAEFEVRQRVNKGPLKLLSQPYPGVHPLLFIGVPIERAGSESMAGVKVSTSARICAHYGPEYLIEFRRETDIADVFYPNNRTVRISRTGNGLALRELSAEEGAQALRERDERRRRAA